MDRFFGYVRVSTARQGVEGVSLQEQRSAITQYAARAGVTIGEWFEERETAAHVGRRVFTRMIGQLRKGKAKGVILHKIDRGARNLRDWIDLIGLSEDGVDVRFTSENLDLRSRGGRLAADIQAVVASDYIRNLREETKKGFYGRLKQGILPLPAPIGYVDCGKGKPKAQDPVTAPLVRQAFELYATGRFGLHDLLTEMHLRGLRNRRNNPLRISGLSYLLNNPFYMGLIRLRRTGETFAGAHAPIISKRLFDDVQAILRGRTPKRTERNEHLFARLVRCADCGYSLIAERQKGRFYYRCHSKPCRGTSVREDAIEEAVRKALAGVQLTEAEGVFLSRAVQDLASTTVSDGEATKHAIALELTALKERLGRLTDAFIDGVLDKALFEDRKAALLNKQRDLDDRFNNATAYASRVPQRVQEFLELAKTASLLYDSSSDTEKRELLLIVTSNRVVRGKNVDITLSPGFQLLAERHNNPNGAPYRKLPRTLEVLAKKVFEWISTEGPDFDLDRFRHRDQDTDSPSCQKTLRVAA